MGFHALAHQSSLSSHKYNSLLGRSASKSPFQTGHCPRIIMAAYGFLFHADSTQQKPDDMLDELLPRNAVIQDRGRRHKIRHDDEGQTIRKPGAQMMRHRAVHHIPRCDSGLYICPEHRDQLAVSLFQYMTRKFSVPRETAEVKADKIVSFSPI